MIDANSSLLDTTSKTSQTSKKVLEKASPSFADYMNKPSEKTLKAKNDTDDASKPEARRETEKEEQSTDAVPVATGVVDTPDQARKKVAEVLKQRASVLDKMSNRQDVSLQKQLVAVEKTMDLDQMSDDLLSKLIEKISLDKSKGDLHFQNRLLVEKILASSDVTDTLSAKMASDASDKSLLLNALGNSDRLNAATSLPQMKMNLPVGHADWGAEFGRRIQMLLKGNIQQAEIRMDPPELGRIQIRINLNQDQANISFTAINANVREAIESNMTRLRDMLSETGLQLGDADVGSDFQQETNPRADEFVSFANAQRQPTDNDEATPLPATVYHSVDGVIDYFA